MANRRLRVYGKGGMGGMAFFYALAIALVAMAVATVFPKFSDLAGARLWLLGAAAGLCIVGWLISHLLAFRIEVRDGKLRVVGRTTIEVGAPRTLRRGQFSRTLRVPRIHNAVGVVGHALLDGEQTTSAWIAVEGATDKPVVFIAHLGVTGSTDWPHGDPPEAHAELYVAARAIRKLEHAVGDLI
jgi:hypothetical protein